MVFGTLLKMVSGKLEARDRIHKFGSLVCLQQKIFSLALTMSLEEVSVTNIVNSGRQKAIVPEVFGEGFFLPTTLKKPMM